MQECQSREVLTHELQDAIRRYEGSRRTGGENLFSSGCDAIDRLLPDQGLRYGMLVEWLARMPGSAAGLIGLLNCGEACKQGGMLVVIDREQNFYPPVAIAWGVAQRQLLVIHPANQAEHVWALVQSLESPAVAAVWSPISRIDSRTYQRVHLAAKTGGTLGVLPRPAVARGDPSWADAQFWVTPVSQDSSRRVEVYLARCRGAKSGGKTILEIDSTNGLLRETTSNSSHSLRLATELANSENPPSRTGT